MDDQGADREAGYPPPDATSTVELPDLPAPTPLPDRGVRTGAHEEIVISRKDIEIGDLHRLDLDGDMLVASARVQNGVTVVGIDLKSGDLRLLSVMTMISSRGPVK